MVPFCFYRKFSDYLLLNASSIKSSGLYQGKAGAVLVLFEIFRLFKINGKDKEVLFKETKTLELLQQTLICDLNDINFEDGLSGIGFVLLYLIKNEFIEADFNELFDENLQKVFSALSNDLNNNEKIVHPITLICF